MKWDLSTGRYESISAGNELLSDIDWDAVKQGDNSLVGVSDPFPVPDPDVPSMAEQESLELNDDDDIPF